MMKRSGVILFVATMFAVAGCGGVNGSGASPSSGSNTSVTPTTTAPAITSAASTTFTVGTAGSFTVTASGSPTPTLALSGTLPTGITFNTSTGVLSGTPTGTAGSYPVTVTASNGIAPNAAQSFTLTLNAAASGGGSGTVSHPYYPATVGSTWNYSNGASGTMSVSVIASGNGSVTTEMVSGTTKSDLTVVINGNQIGETKRYDYTNNVLTYDMTIAPKEVLFPSSTSVGYSETNSFTSSSTLPTSLSTPYSCTVTVAASETVTVPAGTFQNVLKIRETCSVNGSSAGDTYTWYAPNVGVIKSANAVDNTLYWQLVSYTIK